MRNILAHIPSSDKAAFASKLKQIWLQPDYKSAMQYAALLIDEYANKYPKAIAVLEEGLEDSLQYYSLKSVPQMSLSDLTKKYGEGQRL